MTSGPGLGALESLFVIFNMFVLDFVLLFDQGTIDLPCSSEVYVRV